MSRSIKPPAPNQLDRFFVLASKPCHHDCCSVACAALQRSEQFEMLILLLIQHTSRSNFKASSTRHQKQLPPGVISTPTIKSKTITSSNLAPLLLEFFPPPPPTNHTPYSESPRGSSSLRKSRTGNTWSFVEARFLCFIFTLFEPP